MVQWLRLCPPNAGGLGSSPGQGTRSHMAGGRVVGDLEEVTMESGLA